MLKLPRISPAGVMAGCALFLSAGGGAALAATQIDGHTIADRSTPATKIVKHTIGADEMKTPSLHKVGTANGVPFENGWTNPGPYDDQGPVGYEKDASGVVHLTGEARYPGAKQSVIFTLPADDRPAHEKIFTVPVGYHVSANITINAAGQVEIMETTGAVVLDGVSFVAGT